MKGKSYIITDNTVILNSMPIGSFVFSNVSKGGLYLTSELLQTPELTFNYIISTHPEAIEYMSFSNVDQILARIITGDYVESFISLTDTPNKYTSNKLLKFNQTETGIDYVDFDIKYLFQIPTIGTLADFEDGLM